MDKILIIEDEELIREELKTLLSNAGYLVGAAEEFGNVAELVRALAPDLILLDVNLPGRDGYHLCADIRSFSDTPILFLTGRDTSMDELYALTIGGDDYITKPYNVPILLARIKLLLKRGKRGEQAELPEYKGMRRGYAVLWRPGGGADKNRAEADVLSVHARGRNSPKA